MIHPIRSADAEGLAALGICESLVIALTDLKIISDKDAREILSDVATTHTIAAAAASDPGCVKTGVVDERLENHFSS